MANQDFLYPTVSNVSELADHLARPLPDPQSSARLADDDAFAIYLDRTAWSATHPAEVSQDDDPSTEIDSGQPSLSAPYNTPAEPFGQRGSLADTDVASPVSTVAQHT